MRTTGILLGGLLGLMSATSAFAGGHMEKWVGTWTVKDSADHEYHITLKPDGTAEGSREEGMAGSWVGAEDGAEIHWESGWKTKLLEDGNVIRKKAFAPGSDNPANSSTATKVN